MNLVSITVTGEEGAEYTISIHPRKGEASCTCPAYRFATARPCKHIRFVGEAFAGSPAGVRLAPVANPRRTFWKNERTQAV